MNSFSSLLKPKTAADPAAAATPTTPGASSSPFSSFGKSGLGGLHIPGVTLPSLGLGVAPIGIDSTKNSNPLPTAGLYPAVANSGDPNYTVDQESLLGAMHFPKTWNARIKKQPVILVPPTGLYGGTAYRYNFAKLLNDWEFVNYMWLNIPGAMADYSAKNAEYVAYAIHYVAGITDQKVALIAWSQGNLACQWTLKYWPLARTLTNNFISVSADFHGTLTAYAALLPTTPSILNQRYNSDFIRTLRANGGDSAYVPHTSIFSSLFDEIVQPQAGDGASAWMKDEREVGVLNVDVQQTCPGTPAGFLYGHGTLIHNSLTWALAKDAIMHGGPARLDRIDLRSVSMALWAPGLTLDDCIMGVAAMSTFITNCLLFTHKELTEGPMPAYALAESRALGPPEPLSPQHQAIVDQSKKQASKTGLPAAVDPTAMAHAAIQQLKTGQPAPVPATTS